SAAQSAALPEADVQVQNALGLLGELGVARENPVLVPPWLDGVGIQDAPDRAGTDGPAQGHGRSFCQVGGRQATQRQLGLADRLTRDRLDDRAVTRGKKRACDPGRLDRPRRNRHMPSGAARGARSSDATRPMLRPPCLRSPETREAGGPAEPSGAGRVAKLSDGRCFDRDQGNQMETWAGWKAWGQAWRDSIRSENSVLRPNARRIGRIA